MDEDERVRADSQQSSHALYSIQHTCEDVEISSVVTAAIQKHWQRDLADFENHLDDPTQGDYLNEAINEKLEQLL